LNQRQTGTGIKTRRFIETTSLAVTFAAFCFLLLAFLDNDNLLSFQSILFMVLATLSFVMFLYFSFALLWIRLSKSYEAIFEYRKVSSAKKWAFSIFVPILWIAIIIGFINGLLPGINQIPQVLRSPAIILAAVWPIYVSIAIVIRFGKDIWSRIIRSTSNVLNSETIIMLTTTNEPYLFHIPTILSCPNRITYRFRYRNTWLGQEVQNSESDYLRKCNGVLYLRDSTSKSGLCYPIRRFKVLWKEDRGVVTFFNLEMGDIIAYNLAKDSESSTKSWQNLNMEYSRQLEENKCLPPLDVIPVPANNQPPILTDTELHDGIAPEKYVWLDKRAIFAWSGQVSDAEAEESQKWGAIIPIFSLISSLRNICFWRILRLSDLGKRKSEYVPTQITELDTSGLHTRGYKIDVGRDCSTSICQIIPKTFAGEGFEMQQFDINLENSDPGIQQVVPREVIDGTYDTFELSFRLKEEASRKLCRLRIQCTQSLGDRGQRLPPTILPIKVTVPLRYPVFRLLAAIVILFVPFVTVVLRSIYTAFEATVPTSIEIGVPAALLVLAFTLARLGKLITGY
jgi:hypothetical protein